MNVAMALFYSTLVVESLSFLKKDGATYTLVQFLTFTCVTVFTMCGQKPARRGNQKQYFAKVR